MPNSPPDGRPIATGSRRLSIRQGLAVARERLLWNRRTDAWEHEGAAGLEKVVTAVLEECHDLPEGTVALDIGCGSGQVTIPLAAMCERVLAVDVSEIAVGRLQTIAGEAGVTNIQAETQAIETLELAEASLDLIVTNYALHHLRDADKVALLGRARRWLRPGGRLVIGDMMFGRGTDAADRRVIATKARAFIARGPAGWWRLAKNLGRFAFRVWEKPLPAARWESLIRDAGFEQVATRRVVSEACVVSARTPLTAVTPAPDPGPAAAAR